MNDNSIWSSIGKFILKLLINKEDEKNGKLAPSQLDIVLPIDGLATEHTVTQNAPNMEYLPETAINWENATRNITEHFLVGDAIALHSWGRLANSEDGLTDEGKAKLIVLCNKMEEIRKILACPISVHCMYRSPKYNQEVVKVPEKYIHDVHSTFEACDFDANSKYTIDEVHSILEPLLEQLGIRMERNTPSWCHIDLHPVGNARYFLA